MKKYEKRGPAIVVLHEIYGVNPFMQDLCHDLSEEGFHVVCPNMFDKKSPFPYEESSQAYSYFMENVGFNISEKIDSVIGDLKEKHSRVFVMGFSVGATVAWRCGASSNCDGVICCYGSRIRDYLNIDPRCPALLIFSLHDSFDVKKTASKLADKEKCHIVTLEASHGFMDKYSSQYSPHEAQEAFHMIRKFLSDCIV